MSATGYTPRRPLAQIVEPAASHGMTVWQLVEEQYPPRPARSAKATRAAAERGRGPQAFVAQFGFGYHRDSHGVIEAWTIEHRGGRVMVRINAERVQVTELDRFGFNVTVTTFAGPDALRSWAARGIRFAAELAAEVTP